MKVLINDAMILLMEERKVTLEFLKAKLERKQWSDVARAANDMKVIDAKLGTLSALKLPVESLLVQNEAFRNELDKVSGVTKVSNKEPEQPTEAKH